MPDRPARPAARTWTVYAAAAWAFLFAAQSLAAAILATAGSGFGAGTFGADIARLARERDAGFIAVLWLAVLAKSLGGVLVLAWAHQLASRVPPRLLRPVTRACGAQILLYGIANLVQHTLMRSGALAVPHGLGARALPWHLWLWDPYWILGSPLLATPRRQRARFVGRSRRRWPARRRGLGSSRYQARRAVDTAAALGPGSRVAWHGRCLAGVRRSGATFVPGPDSEDSTPHVHLRVTAPRTLGSYRPRRASPDERTSSWGPARTSSHRDDSATGTSSPRIGCSTARECSRTTRSRSGVIGSRQWRRPTGSPAQVS